MALILVADDNQDLTQTVKRALERQGHQVILAHNGPDALACIRQHRPDAVILDVIMPEMDGYAVCRQARSMPELASIPILFLTVKQQIDDLLKGFRAGGDDYVTKPFDVRELEVRVEALLRRRMGKELREKELKVGSLVLDMQTRQIQVENRKSQLTPTEYKLLRYLMQRAGTIVSVDQILQVVWGHLPDTGDPDLVRAHIHNLRAKVEPDPSRPIYIKTIPRHGYLVSPET